MQRAIKLWSIAIVIMSLAVPAGATSFRWDLPNGGSGDYVQVNFNFDWTPQDPLKWLSAADVHSVERYVEGQLAGRLLGENLWFDENTSNTSDLDQTGQLGNSGTIGWLTSFWQYTPPGVYIGFPEGVHIFSNVDEGEKEYEMAGYRVEMEPVPEPGTIVLLGLGMVGLVALRRKVSPKR